MIGLRRKKFDEEWREAIVNDEVRIATLERRVNALARKVGELEERVKRLEEGRS